jgi:hypothetical protein
VLLRLAAACLPRLLLPLLLPLLLAVVVRMQPPRCCQLFLW